MKTLAGANPDAKPDYRTQALNELNKLESKVILLNEILDNVDTARGEKFVQGDVYDPSGTLSGGAAPHSNKALIAVQELLDVERRLGGAAERLRGLEQEEARARRGRDAWRGLAHELDLKEHEMSLLQEQVEGSNASRVSPTGRVCVCDIDRGRRRLRQT